MTLKKINELIAMCEKHFPNHCWLRNLKDAVESGDYLNITHDDDMAAIYAPGVEICGTCGCGRSEEIHDMYRQALRAIRRSNVYALSFCKDPMLEEVVLHILYHFGYTQHGVSIHGSWLTEKGEAALAALDWWFDDVVQGGDQGKEAEAK